jgi:hypothetical protein
MENILSTTKRVPNRCKGRFKFEINYRIAANFRGVLYINCKGEKCQVRSVQHMNDHPQTHTVFSPDNMNRK